jgi:hypothetical protein
MVDDVVAEHPFERAEDFLAALRPNGPLWRASPESWIFRGHADSRWLLLPSVNRRKALGAYFGTRYEGQDAAGPKAPYCQPLPADQASLLKTFAESLDRAGFVVPGAQLMGIKQVVLHLEENLVDDVTEEVIALAQHHKLPTRFLDWTRHGTVAAYFAASEVAELPAGSMGYIEVWALNRNLSFDVTERHSIMDGGAVRLYVVAPPRGGNRNLHAQGGVFTYAAYDVREGQLRTVDEIAKELAPAAGFREPAMHRLRLPRAEAGSLLRWLGHEGVTGGTLFPEVGGVVRDVRDRHHYGDVAGRLVASK